VAPDLVGFGRSDKPADRSDYTYNRHVGWMQAWLDQVDLKRITLVCQDWGGLIGLRLLAAHPERFARAVVANTGLPTGDFPISEAFLQWRTFSVEVPEFNVGAIVNMGTLSDLPEEIQIGRAHV
jgi:haloalkane dehalogenase